MNNELEKAKLNQLLTDVDNLEDFIKISTADYKIDQQTGNEILRILTEAKTRALN